MKVTWVKSKGKKKLPCTKKQNQTNSQFSLKGFFRPSDIIIVLQASLSSQTLLCAAQTSFEPSSNATVGNRDKRQPVHLKVTHWWPPQTEVGGKEGRAGVAHTLTDRGRYPLRHVQVVKGKQGTSHWEILKGPHHYLFMSINMSKGVRLFGWNIFVTTTLGHSCVHHQTHR